MSKKKIDMRSIRQDGRDISFSPNEGDIVQLDQNDVFCMVIRADINPRDPKSWMVPGGAIQVDTLPDLSKKCVAWQFNRESNQWVEIPDYRKAKVYHTETKEVILSNEIQLGQSLADLNGTLSKPKNQLEVFDEETHTWTLQFNTLKENLMAELKRFRWSTQNETTLILTLKPVARITTSSGTMRIRAGVGTINALTSIIQCYPDDEIIDFVGVDKAYRLGMEQVKDLLYQLSKYNQSCFVAEIVHTENINAIKYKESMGDDKKEKAISVLKAYNIHEGWSSPDLTV